MELDFCRVEAVSAQAYCQRSFLHTHTHTHTHKTETHLHRESREVGGGPREGWKSVFYEVTRKGVFMPTDEIPV